MDPKQLAILANDPDALASMKSVMKAAGIFSEDRWSKIVRRVNAHKRDKHDRPIFYVRQVNLVAGKDVENLLCCAFAGGSNYWYENLDIHIPPLNYTLYEWKSYLIEHDLFWHLSTPVFGGKLELTDKETKVQFILDADSIEKGLNIMARDYPFHFQSFTSDNADAITGDVFLQCCIFDEVVYG